jgi:chromosome segregation ATPase
VVDYEALYSELQKRLDEQEQSERVRQLQLDKQCESIESQEAAMEALRDEVKALTAHNEQLKASSNSSGDGSDSESKKCMDDMAAQSALELNNMKARYEKRIAAYKSAAAESAQEISELQYDIRTEREKHLATLKDLSVVSERYSESERAFEFRVQELLSELEEARSLSGVVEKQTTELEEKESKISELEEKIYLLEENGTSGSGSGSGGGDMVSRQQVEEMEKMFSETVDQLVKRVLLLEESKSGGKGVSGVSGVSGGVSSTVAMGDSDEEDEMAYLDKVGPNLRKNRQSAAGGSHSHSHTHSHHLPPAVPVRSNSNARFEPGKVRANGNSSSSSSGGVSGSHHIGGNFGGVKNSTSRRF